MTTPIRQNRDRDARRPTPDDAVGPGAPGRARPDVDAATARGRDRQPDAARGDHRQGLHAYYGDNHAIRDVSTRRTRPTASPR